MNTQKHQPSRRSSGGARLAMRAERPVLALLVTLALGCGAPVAYGEDGAPIFRQSAISDIACGPSALFNWLGHGGRDLRKVLDSLSDGRTPVQVVEHLIEAYGQRASATNPSVTRYGRHNGGVGSVNLMLMAKEVLADHLGSPAPIVGEYLQRREGESPEEHLLRIAGWFEDSIESGVPVILYVRRYQRTTEPRAPRMVFGHHVVVTSVGVPEEHDSLTSGRDRVPFGFVDSASGTAERGELTLAGRTFTAPTYRYRFEGSRAFTTEEVRTGSPLLEVRVPRYDTPRSLEKEVTVAHFATFADRGR